MLKSVNFVNNTEPGWCCREQLLDRVTNVGQALRGQLEIFCREFPGLVANARYCMCVGNLNHTSRRRINTEENAKVVTAAWGTELIPFLSALAILHQDDLKKRINRITARMDALIKWMISRFRTKTTILQKWLFSHKLFFKSSLLL